MNEPRYTLTLTAAQLWALDQAFNANFAGGVDEEGDKAEKQVARKLERLGQKAYDHRKGR